MLGTSLSYLAALAAGIASFLSPCVLPLVPAYLSYVAGTSFDRMVAEGAPRPRRILAAALTFVAGFALVFVALGASASAINVLLFEHLGLIAKVAGAAIVVFGLHYLGVFRRLGVLGFLDRDVRFHGAPGAGGTAGAFVMGVAFGFGWTPCIGPILGAILTVSAVQTSTSAGVALLATYAAGLGVPFLLAALFTRELAWRLKGLRRIGTALQIAAGLILVLMGVAMITGQLSSFGFWLLRTFPVFGRIG